MIPGASGMASGGTVDREGQRSCEVCGSLSSDLLHRQPFLLPGGGRVSYDVVSCADCGFIFAKNLPSPGALEAYYRENLKYLYEGSEFASPSLEAVHRDSFALVDSFVREHSPPFAGTATRVLDIGCSTGVLLSLFRQAGYRHLLGVDPAPECREVARSLHGIEVMTGSLSTFRTDVPFDVVLLSSVLEHVVDLPHAVRRIASLLRDGGLLFVLVPDADRFGFELREPFLEFSIEHVNYFSRGSLEGLFSPLGFAPVVVRAEVALVNRTSFPILASLWIRGSAHGKRPPLRSDVGPVRRYIEMSRERLAALEDSLAPLVASGEEVVLWGAGSLASRLLATTSLARINVAGVVDNNSGLQGKTLARRTIEPPATLRGRRTTVVVTSYVWGEEIRRTLVDDYHYEGRVVTLP
jgi:SAM-dependent methyltransferase